MCYCSCLRCHRSRLSRTELDPTSLVGQECRNNNKGLLLLLSLPEELETTTTTTTESLPVKLSGYSLYTTHCIRLQEMKEVNL